MRDRLIIAVINMVAKQNCSPYNGVHLNFLNCLLIQSANNEDKKGENPHVQSYTL